MKIRLRYAPSPTGYLHIGNARTALFNYLYAKHYDGDFIVRIEDTDISRNVSDGVESQLRNLKWLGIEWDESVDIGGEYGPYSQIERFEKGIYNKYVDDLLEQGKAYKCYCTSEELDAAAEQQKNAGLIPKYSGTCRNLTEEQISEFEKEGRSYTVRFKVDEAKIYTWNDIVKGEVSFTAKDVTGDFNIAKRNGVPLYNFAVVIDDHLMEISHVVRGEDHISNTPKQMMIYDALNFEHPIFGHMTLIVNENNKKLSKRDTDIIQFVEDYRNLGYLPEAMFNFFALLGWSPEGTEEIFSRDELINIFDETRLSKSSAKFDVNKLRFLNNQYIKNMELNDYINFVKPFFDEVNELYNEEDAVKILELYKDQISYGAEIRDVSTIFFNDISEIEEEALPSLEHVDVINLFKKKISESDVLTSDGVKAYIKEVGKELDVKGKALFMPIRIATTGQLHGPDLAISLEILGKERVIRNITTSLTFKK